MCQQRQTDRMAERVIKLTSSRVLRHKKKLCQYFDKKILTQTHYDKT